MTVGATRRDRRATTFLGRFRHDTRGNTLAMMAIALIPMSALAGSAVDMARLYVVKVRLQQACDAGVLAGRKFMADSDAETLDGNATTRATQFFTNNFNSGWMRTNSVSFIPSKTADNQVSADASAVVPMTLMKMFDAADATLSVTCEARYDIADTDIVFVLDTTGSMACRPEHTEAECQAFVNSNPAQSYTRPLSDPDATTGYLGSRSFAVPETTHTSGSRIAALRTAVKDFYSTLAANVDPSTNVRYGFVSYTSTVNAGKAIYDVSPSYIVGGLPNESWNYQSRGVSGEYASSATGYSNTSLSYSRCVDAANNAVRTPAATQTNPYPFNGTTGEATRPQYRWSNDRCQERTLTLRPTWTHRQYTYPVSDFVAGLAVPDPTKAIATTSRWDGCIEERRAESGTTTFGSNSYDLDPTLIPGADIDTRWKPMWTDVIYERHNNVNAQNTSTGNQIINGDSAQGQAYSAFLANGFATCGKPIHRLSPMSATAVAAYVEAIDFKPLGGTYHDVGMIWGARLLAPGGIFAADTAASAGRKPPNRIIVFLTDGAMAPNQNIYGLYGLEYFDRRVSNGTFSSLTTYHNARFVAACERAKALKVDVWTVALGMGTTTELTKCASSTAQALDTTTGSGLSDAFKKIAKQVATLRVSK